MNNSFKETEVDRQNKAAKIQHDTDNLTKERHELLERIQNVMEVPMIVLGFVWLVLLVIELTRGLSSLLQLISNFIWMLFILDFLLKFILAPAKKVFFKSNVLTIISLALPALRIFRIGRILQTVRAARSLRLVKVVSSLNRGMRSLGTSMGRRGFGYVAIFTLVVLLTGAAGMYAFENQAENGLTTYGEALWWTAMLLISIGSEYWPQTPEGRALCFLLSVYGFAVFGYFTATLATFFIGRDAENDEAEVAGAKQVEALHQEIATLRKEMQLLLQYTREQGKNDNAQS
jgi:voltage-gated potassium channel